METRDFSVDLETSTIQELPGFYPHLVRQGIFKGVNLVPLVAKFWRLESMRVHPDCSEPEVRWRAFSHRRGASGVASPVYRMITLRLSPLTTIEDAVETLLHEIVHCALPRENHSELFCRRLIATAREAFGIDLDSATLLAFKPGTAGKRAYAIDEYIVAQMQHAHVGRRLREDPLVRFDPPPPETDEQIEARRIERAAAKLFHAKRHAEEKLAEWDKAVRDAKRLRKKWATKVRYYERREESLAAKRPKGDAS